MKLAKFKYSKGRAGYFLHITEGEAHSILQSISNQLVGQCGNAGRTEYFLEDGSYFSISVTEAPPVFDKERIRVNPWEKSGKKRA